ncbi:hypothetical protein LQ318_08605 [Aliifodinibius salicampi]|uniref:Uncharacterized protein n=1 Tax=Fodinibius salicampi TaxID=1920655 RepID=A0ABT3PYN5_9BACT|nr:hypothetical protein [Fodinibius salicampi]MCW9712964.1 hypothetical protein [Fodinibius salicampi]
MTESNSHKEDPSGNSTKRLVKVLVIIGIGIPVLVELMTLFNLINVQIFEGEQEVNQQNESIAELRAIEEGDTLFADYSNALTINLLRIKVSAQEWRFALGLNSVDSLVQQQLQVKVDSLKLQSGKILSGTGNNPWEIDDTVPLAMSAEWELPNGDIPGILYISSFQYIESDSTKRIQQEIPLGKIPVRYNQE